jgi:hypothetical protein
LADQAPTTISRARLFGAAAAALGAAGLAACGGDPEDPNESGEGFETATSGQFGERTVAPSDPAVTKAFGLGDIGIAKYALTLEYIEQALYEELMGTGFYEGEDLALLGEIADNEDAHVRQWERFLDGSDTELPERPRVRFKFDNRRQALDVAREIEDVGAAAYLGQLNRIVRGDLLSLALSIQTAEGAHAAALARRTNRTIVPDGAIASPLNAQEVLVLLKPFVADEPEEEVR